MKKAGAVLLILGMVLAIGCQKQKKSLNDNLDAKEGVVKAYLKDGTLFSETTMKDGKKNGVSRTYFASGKISTETNFINNKKEGLFKQFYEDGTLMKAIDYKADEIDGLSKKYRADGTPAWQAHFTNGKPCRDLVEYYLNGKQKTDYPKIVFEADDRIKEQGEFVLHIRMSDNTNTVVFYEGFLTPEGCLDLTKVRRLYTEKGKTEMQHSLPPGAFMMQEVNIIAVIKTAQSNTYITTAQYNLSISN